MTQWCPWYNDNSNNNEYVNRNIEECVYSTSSNSACFFFCCCWKYSNRVPNIVAVHNFFLSQFSIHLLMLTNSFCYRDVDFSIHFNRTDMKYTHTIQIETSAWNQSVILTNRNGNRSRVDWMLSGKFSYAAIELCMTFRIIVSHYAIFKQTNRQTSNRNSQSQNKNLKSEIQFYNQHSEINHLNRSGNNKEEHGKPMGKRRNKLEINVWIETNFWNEDDLIWKKEKKEKKII